MTTWHESRLWNGNDKDRFEECTCEAAACGYVTPNESCPQHSLGAGKTLRRAHPADQCAGVGHHQGKPEPDVTGPVRTER